MTIYNAIVKSFQLGYNDRQQFCLIIDVEFERGGQSFILIGEQVHDNIEALLSTIFCVRSLADIVEKPCRVESKLDILVGIGHFYKDKWVRL